MSNNHKFGVGVVICTLDPQAFTNAIIINETNNGQYIVLTDFGNIRHIPVDQIHNYYEVSENYLDAIDIGYPLPTISERIQHQINLLTDALSVVKQLQSFTK